MDRRERIEERRRRLEAVAPGSGLAVGFDRGAWAAFNQGAPGSWSWPRALVALLWAVAMVAIVVFVIGYDEVTWIIGLSLAYALMLWRARRLYRRSSALPSG